MAKLRNSTQNKNLGATNSHPFFNLNDTTYGDIISLRLELLSAFARNQYGPFPPLLAQKALYNLTSFLDQQTNNPGTGIGVIWTIHHWFAEYRDCLLYSPKPNDQRKAQQLNKWVMVLASFLSQTQ